VSILASGTSPYPQGMRWLFWLPLSLSAVLVLVVLAGLVAVSWRSLERLQPVQRHLAHIGRIRQAGLGMEQALLQGLQGTRLGPGELKRIREEVRAITHREHHLHPAAGQRLEQLTRRLDGASTDLRSVLPGALAQLRQMLGEELALHDRLLAGMARDSETELRLAVALLVTLPLVGGGLLWLLRIRIKRPMDNLGDLLRRLAARDYTPVAATTLSGSAAVLQPVLHSYNALVLRLKSLEREHLAREHTLEQEVRQATEALLSQSRELARAERLAAVGEVSAGLAHELRNPLAGIQMACTKLHRNLTEPDQVARITSVITELKRVNGLLTAQVDAARHAPEPLVRVRLAELVEQFLVLMRYQVPDTVALEARVPRELECLLPAAGLRQALLNLVLNGVQVLGDGGRVSISARSADDRLLLEVADDGPGFPEELLRVGVRPFVTGRAAGTGLGLAMVRRLARDLGGELTLANRKPRGALVTLSLPCDVPGEDEAEEQRHA
jgi:two-component system NtrC family sensor kinase